MLEGKWDAVPPQLLTANGSPQGLVTVADTAGFRVKQAVVLQGTAIPNLPVQIKRVLSRTLLVVGANDNKVNQWKPVDVSAFTVAANSFISAEQQVRTATPPDGEHYNAIYESDPVVADRVVQVDKYGNFYDLNNPMPIVFDGTVAIGDVSIVDPDSGKHLKINADGSINVIVESVPSTNAVVVSNYNEILAIPSGLTSQIVTYTVPPSSQAILQRCPVSGENVARYDLLINGTVQDTIRTMFGGDLTGMFDFTSGNDSGLLLVAGDIVKLQVLHNRPDSAAFEGRIQVLQIAL